MANKCGHKGCFREGIYQPMLLLRPSIQLMDNKDILCQIRVPMTLCLRHKSEATDREIVALVPKPTIRRFAEEATRRTGASVNLERTTVTWVRILGRRTDGPSS